MAKNDKNPLFGHPNLIDYLIDWGNPSNDDLATLAGTSNLTTSSSSGLSRQLILIVLCSSTVILDAVATYLMMPCP